jgi:hypothetical protein
MGRHCDAVIQFEIGIHRALDGVKCGCSEV